MPSAGTPPPLPEGTENRALDAAATTSAWSPLLPDLFEGLPVLTAERLLGEPLPPPLLEDLQAVAGAADKRRLEYLAGRHCARVALARAGVEGFVLRSGADRAPLWPAGMVGSITHTGTAARGYCAAVVARAADLAGVGLDAELRQPLPPELWDMVLTPQERRALERFPPEARAELATVLFSAKESVYKALFPLHRRFIDFQEVAIEVDPPAGRFTARVQAGPLIGSALVGRVRLAPWIVLTAATAATSSG